VIAHKDIPVLISAIRGGADFLVTGDKQHFERFKGTGKYPLRIISPSEFIDSILSGILEEPRKSEINQII